MSWISKLKAGLSKTSSKIISGIDDIFNKRRLGADTALELEDLLITTDMGAENAQKIVKQLLEQHKFSPDVTEQEIKNTLSEIISNIINPCVPKDFSYPTKPKILVMCGVNGNGKTTSTAKLANFFQQQDKKIMFAACDTFRAAAVDQLAVWAERLNIQLVRGEENTDPASVAFKAVKKAIEENIDVLFIDTAGRLHNKENLMAELAKIIKVIKKVDSEIDPEIILVLDATTGQNALTQIEKFKEISSIDGLIMTKLDGTAKGGILVAIAQKYQLPIIALGVGEGINDLRPFDGKTFAQMLVGL